MEEAIDLDDFNDLFGIIPWALVEELDDQLDAHEELLIVKESLYDAIEDLILDIELS